MKCPNCTDTELEITVESENGDVVYECLSCLYYEMRDSTGALVSDFPPVAAEEDTL